MWLRNELAHSDRFQGFVWLLSDEPEAPVKTVPTVEDIILRPAFLESADKIDYVCNHLGLKDDEVQFVREQTCGQSRNPLWACYRKGRVTASNSGAVLKNIESKRRPAKSLLKTLLGNYDMDSVHTV